MFYFKGLHVPIDFTIAWEYIEKAASFGDNKCMQWLEPEVKQAIDKKFKEEINTITNENKLSSCNPNNSRTSIITELAKKLKRQFLLLKRVMNKRNRTM